MSEADNFKKGISYFLTSFKNTNSKADLRTSAITKIGLMKFLKEKGKRQTLSFTPRHHEFLCIKVFILPYVYD